VLRLLSADPFIESQYAAYMFKVSSSSIGSRQQQQGQDPFAGTAEHSTPLRRHPGLASSPLTSPSPSLLFTPNHTQQPPQPQYDSVHGRYEGSVEDSKEGITIDGHMIKVFSQM
jgi:hypothetical protein